jgi:hypothetical protein
VLELLLSGPTENPVSSPRGATKLQKEKKASHEEICSRSSELQDVKLSVTICRPVVLTLLFSAGLRIQDLSAQTLLNVSSPSQNHLLGNLILPAQDTEQKSTAESQLREEEHQRILGLLPNFNTTEIPDAQPLSADQKFSLAAKSSFDPFTFIGAGIDAAMGQSERDFPAYRQGAVGYSKRFGASYADGLSSAMIGNALLPVLFKQDPRYFRKGAGSFANRFAYALLSAVQCRNDDGRWTVNYSNILGNLAAGGISNIYYPAAQRGASLTFQRSATVTMEGAIGSVFFEFWPDIARAFRSRHVGSNSH